MESSNIFFGGRPKLMRAVALGPALATTILSPGDTLADGVLAFSTLVGL